MNRRPSLVTDLDEPRRDDAEQLVPFDVQRARVVRLELEPAALETHDLTGDPVAVGKGDDVGPALAVRHTAGREGEAQRQDHVCSQRPPCETTVLTS